MAQQILKVEITMYFVIIDLAEHRSRGMIELHTVQLQTKYSPLMQHATDSGLLHIKLLLHLLRSSCIV